MHLLPKYILHRHWATKPKHTQLTNNTASPMCHERRADTVPGHFVEAVGRWAVAVGKDFLGQRWDVAWP